ncbi:hypothetical protein MKX03_036841 [Papaver bracteatum]|nr:hypothetical protein MKX03_036841 [Papaver bracteatum]
MDLFTAAEDLKFFSADQIIKEAVKIPARSSPIKFLLITLTLILPLSLIQLLLETQSFILFFIFSDYFSGNHHSYPSYKQFIRSYSTIFFIIASLYASKSVSFIPTLFVIPRIFEHLIITFFYVLCLMVVSYLAYYVPISFLAAKLITNLSSWGFLSYFLPYTILFLSIENLYFLRTCEFVLWGYMDEHVFLFAIKSHVHFMVKILLGFLCLFMLVVVNITGLLVQSVFYYACKSHHNEVVDKKLLYDHLSSYDLDDKYVALNPSCTRSVEMQSLVKDDHHRVGYQHVALNAVSNDSTIKMEVSVEDDDIVGDLINV